MRIRIVLASSIALIFFCKFQCYRQPFCADQSVTKKININISNAQKTYHIGDSIRLHCSFPYSDLNDLVNNTTPPQRYTSRFIFSIFELTGNSLTPYNGQYAGNKFDYAVSNGLFIPAPPQSAGYSHQQYDVVLKNDSATGVYYCDFIVVPKQTGSFIFLHAAGDMSRLAGDCPNTYYIRYSSQWNISSRNLEIANELSLPASLLLKDYNFATGGFYPRADDRFFYFYVQ